MKAIKVFYFRIGIVIVTLEECLLMNFYRLLSMAGSATGTGNIFEFNGHYYEVVLADSAEHYSAFIDAEVVNIMEFRVIL